jgi:hypothetical protein
MYLKVEDMTYAVELARLSGSGAEVKVTGGKLPSSQHEWVEFSADEVNGCFDIDGEERSAAQELVCRWAVEQVHHRLT